MHIGADRPFYLTTKQEVYFVELIKSLEVIGVRLTKIILRKVVREFIRFVSNNPRLDREYLRFDVNIILILVF